MAFSQDSWMTSYDVCEGVAIEIMEQISFRNQQNKNSVASSKASALARKLMKKYDDNLTSLKQTLMASRSILTDGEFQRRQGLIDNLTSKKIQINEAFSGRDAGGNRLALFGDNIGGHSSNVWDIEESEATRDLTIDEIKQQQQVAIQEQDKGLDTLYSVVVRQKQMAQNIGEELDIQNEIIDDIVDHAGNTRERLIKETRHVALIDRKSGSCTYWAIIVLLFITIIVVAFVPV